MTDKKPDKPVTLADYISSEPAPQRTSKRRAPTKSDREKLRALEREAGEIQPSGRDKKKRRVRVKKSGSLFKTLFWTAVLFGLLLLFID